MLGILPMLLSMFLTNVPSQAAIVMNAVGSTLVLYVCIAKYGGHVKLAAGTDGVPKTNNI